MKALYIPTLLGLLAWTAAAGCASTPPTAPGESVSVTRVPASASPAESPSSRIEQIRIPSHALGREMTVSVYLPPGYDPDVRYPVLYALYGYGGTHASWFDYLSLDDVADRLIREGRLHPLLIVSPDYGNSFGVNSSPADGRDPGTVSIGRYEDYLMQEVVPYVDDRYSTQDNKSGRSIGGASMGGYAALYLGFNHPGLFGKVGAHSAALWTYSASDLFTDQRDWLYASEALRAKRDPFKLISPDKLAGMRVYLDAGEYDPLAEQDQALYEALKAQGIDAVWSPAPGGHDAGYWSSQLERYLLFYAGKK
ncbi:alpha/beta hydrolase [Paenibacillus methanolicus]|uniref:Enterochelin esterase-like enzyme n=1 Tax=Paenibacillus methanolicus TaxID=582686 RepID=A0A5S5CGS7_9BACL|nr:alpha/beta hydrolase-fold protein [Paenibacillus methanolicus]TYP77540.1 enterochelin esterase-like enzyme [Paenibacillus methanolicus]